MHILKLSLAFATLLLITSALLLNSQSALIAAANWGMDHFSEFRLQLREPHIDIFRGRAYAREIEIFPKIGGPALFSATELKVKTSLMDIYRQDLANSTMVASNALVYIAIAETESSDQLEPLEWLRYLGWLPQNLGIAQFHLVLEALETEVFKLEELTGLGTMNNSYHISAVSEIDGQPLDLQLEAHLVAVGVDRSVLTLAGKLLSPKNDQALELDGQLMGNVQEFTYKLDVSGHTDDISNLISFLDAGFKLEGALEFSGVLEGDTRSYSISDVMLKVDNTPAYGFSATAEYHEELSGGNQLKATARGELNSAAALIDWIGIDLTALGSARASVQVSGSLEQPSIDQFLLNTSSQEGLNVGLSGAMTLGSSGARRDNLKEQILVHLDAPTLGLLSGWLGPLPYEPGPWRASARLNRTEKGLRISEIVFDAGTGERLQIHGKGYVGEFIAPTDDEPMRLIGIDLELSAYSDDPANLVEQLADISIPEIQSIQGDWRILGSEQQLEIRDGKFTILDEGVDASLSGLQATIEPDNDSLISEFSAQLNLHLEDAKLVSRYLELEIPTLGPVDASGVLQQVGGDIQLQNLAAHLAGKNGMQFNSNGEIASLSELSGVSLSNSVSGLDTRQLLALAEIDLPYAGSLGRIEGSFDLVTSDSKWNIVDLSLAIAEESNLRMSLKGHISDLGGVTTSKLFADLRISDPDLLYAASGLRVGSTTVKAVIDTQPGAADMKANALVGRTHLKVEGGLKYHDQNIGGLNLSIASPLLYLEDFGLQAQEQDSGETYSPAENIATQPSGGILKTIIEKSPQYPTDIAVDIGGIRGDALNMDSLTLHFTGADKRYTLKDLTAHYSEKVAGIRGVIDLQVSPPAFSLGGDVRSVIMNDLINDLGLSGDVTGTLTLRGGITARGTSSEALLESMDGNLAIALVDATIAGAAYDVLATDFLGWLYSGAALEESTEIECVRAKFRLDDGQARSDNLLIETRRMIAKGKGAVDLVNGTMELHLTPKSKTRIGQIPNSITIQGDFDDPTVKVSAVKAGANLYSEILLIVPNMVMKLLKIERSSRAEACVKALTTVQ